MTEREMGALRIERISFDKIRAAEYNPRVDLLPGDREWQEIEASLDEFGLVEPLVWNEATGNLVGGHQRLKIMKAKGRVEADFSVIHEPDPIREKALNIRLNGTHGKWDVAALTDLNSSDDLQRLSGFSDDDLAALHALSERDEALGMLAQEAARVEASGTGRADAKDLGADVSDLNIPVTRDQRRAILEAVAFAKEMWGQPTTSTALAAICEFFAENARPAATADD